MSEIHATPAGADAAIEALVAEIARAWHAAEHLAAAARTDAERALAERADERAITLEKKLLSLPAGGPCGVLAKLKALIDDTDWHNMEQIDARRFPLDREAVLIAVRRDLERLTGRTV